jgi:hypothetical protein
VHPIIAQIVDRDCHVSLSNREVVRHVISQLKSGYHTFRAMKKRDRRRLIEECVARHRANWLLYAAVMNGAGYGGISNRAKGSPRSLCGQEIVELMRVHRVSIAWLAFRLGTTETRVRYVQQHGLRSDLAVRDWLHAIRGGEPGSLPERYRVRDGSEETECGFCGYPFLVGDDAFKCEGGVYCSTSCCRMTRGWF